MDVQPNVAIITKFLDAMARGSVQELSDMATDNFCWTVMTASLSGLPWNKSTYLEMMSRISNFFDGPFTITATGWTCQDDRIAVEARAQGSTKTGKSYNNLYHFLFHVKDGKVSGGCEYMDSQHAQDIFG